MKSPEKIVIFDYSGTLSPEAPRFGRRENLVRALAETGLAAFGVATPEVFWGEIVGPTWTEGSTTAAGYKSLMAEKVRGLRAAQTVPESEIAAACARFVDRYLANSRIDPQWRPLLSRLTAIPDTCGIIATDHYAEATEAILGFLRAWDIPARRMGTDPYPPPSGENWGGGSGALERGEGEARTPSSNEREKNGDRPLLSIPGSIRSGDPSSFRGSAAEENRGAVPIFPLFVANSADLGFWKADRRFWEMLRSRLSPETVRRVLKEKGVCPRFQRILIVDDFGFNEEAGDLYGRREKVLARQEKTAGLLREVFHAEVEVIPFFLEGEARDSEEVWSRRIDEAAARIERFLEMTLKIDPPPHSRESGNP